MTNPQQTTPPLLQNRYRVSARLGENRLAIVYHATDERLNRAVLIHLLRPELQTNEQLRRRFADEAQGLARRTHPALLDVYDSGEVGSRPFMITEEPIGKPLNESLPLPLTDAITILRQVVGAVATTISTQTPTPPLSSRSIIVTATGRAVIVEPWWLSPAELRDELAAYRAPERALGGPPDERSTVYALGVLGYELTSGQRPNPAEAMPTIYNAVNGFLPSLAAALTLATARDLATRTASVQALARDLAAVESVAESPTKQLVRPVPALRESVREVRRNVTQRRSQPLAPPPDVAPSASAAPAWNVPPPRPMMPPSNYVPPAPAEPQVSPADMRREVQREVKREARRRGCLHFLQRRVISLVLLVGLVFGCYWGVRYGYDWTTDGRGKGWLCSYIPTWACDFVPGPIVARGETPSGPVAYTTTLASVNIRSSPALNENNVIAALPEGTRVVAPNPDNQVTTEGVTWLRVEVDFKGRQINGWVSRDLLQQEGTP